MTKTIEEAAKSIAKGFIMENKSRINNDAPLTYECVQYAIERVIALPLEDRLNDSEKFMIRRLHREFKMLYTENRHSIFRWSEGYQGKYELLESIFGSDFFKEEE